MISKSVDIPITVISTFEYSSPAYLLFKLLFVRCNQSEQSSVKAASFSQMMN